MIWPRSKQWHKERRIIYIPWNPAQHRLFAFAATNPEKAKEEGIKIPQHTALKMMKEGIKKPEKSKKSAIKHLGIQRTPK